MHYRTNEMDYEEGGLWAIVYEDRKMEWGMAR